jgi:hypothetical protein
MMLKMGGKELAEWFRAVPLNIKVIVLFGPHSAGQRNPRSAR